MKKIILIFLFALFSLFPNPIRLQRDQINYIYHGEKSDELTLSKFHNLFLLYYSKTFEELSAKKSFPVTVHLYFSPNIFTKETGQPAFTGALYNLQNGVFYFLLTSKTVPEEKLITLISHELCHAAMRSIRLNENPLYPSLEEGFCFLFYATLLNPTLEETKFCRLSFQEFQDMIDSARFMRVRKDRESMYRITALFLESILKTKNRAELIEILTDIKYRYILENSWNSFMKICPIPKVER